MKHLNLSEWALNHRQFILYLIIVLTLGGVLAYNQLGRSEDPDYVLKTMVVRTLWPGATALELEQQVSEKIERKLLETPWVDYVKSSSKPGESFVYVTLKDYTPPEMVPEIWYQVRKRVDDMRSTLPAGIQGPFSNDEFGDVLIKIYALTGDGVEMPELRRHADQIARELRRVRDVKKIDMLGIQDEKIFIETRPDRLAAMGLAPLQVFDALQRQNAVAPAGFVETATDRVRLRVDGAFKSAEQFRESEITIGDKHFRLGDIATVTRALSDPPQPRMRFMGKDAVGFGVVMLKGGNVLGLGKNVDELMARIERDLPVGVEVNVVADQPKVVRLSFALFFRTLLEAIGIVLLVSFVSLGWRTGMVVALSIPLALAITFIVMNLTDIPLQRVSLGALVISLGLLVDDAIIAVEMMMVKIEQGWDRMRAATFAYTSTAFPMLTGTLITVAGFAPVYFAKSGSGEYTGSIFLVVAIALITSWFVAVIFTPYLGYVLLTKVKSTAHGGNAAAHDHDIYDKPFYRRFRALVVWCLRHRWLVIAITVASFVASLVLFDKAVPKQFFPSASRAELMIDVWLPQGASLAATTREVKRVEQLISGDENIESWSSYIGTGVPRFFLSLDQQLVNDNFGQFMLLTKGVKERDLVRAKLEKEFANPDGSWAHLRLRTTILENGPPVNYVVQFRVSGENIEQLRAEAAKVATVMRAHPNLVDVNSDWNDRIKSVRVEIDQARARALGVSSQDVAQTLQGWLVGATITQLRENDLLIDVVWRAGGGKAGADLRTLGRIPELDIVASNGRHVPLAQIAKLVPELEEGLIWRRHRLPTITLRADVKGIQGPDASNQINAQLAEIREALPPGYVIEMGGAVEESGKGSRSIQAVMPYMVIGVITLLMMQLQSIGRTLIALLTAPLGLIGVTMALMIFQIPFGFVANLGVIALMGMILRNSVILIDQIAQDEAEGKPLFNAIVDSTVRRFRPIVLTAAASILAMVPLVSQVFWGPMAVSVMGGLLVATLLTCLFLPALYAAWYRVRE
ncbi:MAG: efflux RND transporter permease subunit [Rhodocyclaceae bacterium]|nr:efflux RND transporter permease subunit [Rhodocyclaceae bacterium]